MIAKQTSTDGKKECITINDIRTKLRENFSYSEFITDIRIFKNYYDLERYLRWICKDHILVERYLGNLFRYTSVYLEALKYKRIFIIGTDLSVSKFFSFKAMCVPKSLKLAPTTGFFSLFVYEDAVLFIELYMIRRLPEVEHLFGKNLGLKDA